MAPGSAPNRVMIDDVDTPFECYLYLPPKRGTMKILKYSLLTLAVVMGTEILYKSLKYAFALFCQESCDSIQEDSCDRTRKKTINKVIFFPDQGILSRYIQQDSIPREGNSNDKCQYTHKYPHHSKLIIRPSDEKIVPHSSYLKRSTSLIHIVDALDSAKHSLKVCVYVITLQDLVNALLRAKVSGLLFH